MSLEREEPKLSEKEIQGMNFFLRKKALPESQDWALRRPPQRLSQRGPVAVLAPIWRRHKESEGMEGAGGQRWMREKGRMGPEPGHLPRAGWSR